MWIRDLTEDGDVESHPRPIGGDGGVDKMIFAKIIAINADKMHPPVVKDSWGRVTSKWKSEGHLSDLVNDC